MSSPTDKRSLQRQVPVILLTGRDLTIAQVISVARQQTLVAADPAAMRRVEQAHTLLLQAARAQHPIYGLNRGVGLNRDRAVLSGAVLDPEIRRLSAQFNYHLLRAHSAGIGPAASEEVVRATMLIRLNTLLTGHSGAQPQVVDRYLQFLNQQIHPVLPSRGSMGEADITLLAHIGLAMIGEGEVVFAGRRMAAHQALQEAQIASLVPLAKDALSILSSNAYSAALATLTAYDATHLLSVALRVFALSLEGLNGNIAPFLDLVHRLRPYVAQGEVAARIRTELQDSYLWERSEQRALQDPLSYRTASHLLGTATHVLDELKRMIVIQINSSDDNPAVILESPVPSDLPEQVAGYYVKEGASSGAIIPTANFEPLPWVLPLEALGIALSHLSHSAVQRITRLQTPSFTHLTRFLAPDESVMAYGAIQKPLMALDAENRALSNPVSADFFPAAGEIEDIATNAASVAQRVGKMVDNLYYILGMELMHAAQAVDLRRRANPHLRLGYGTTHLFEAYREIVPVLDQDRVLTTDIDQAYSFLKALPLEGASKRKC